LFCTSPKHALKAFVLKGDLTTSGDEWIFNSKREVPLLWTGDTKEDFTLCLNGFSYVPVLLNSA
jgi:hypothetical protein